MRTRSVEPPLPAPRRSTSRLLPRLGLALGLAGCSGLEPVASHEAVTDPTQLYMGLRLEERAINLSTAAGYNTVQLTATPRDGRGDVISGLPRPTFRVANAGDSIRLHITPEGLVTALQPGTEIEVIAELVVPGPGQFPVRHADTAHISVQDLPLPPTLASVSIDPAPPDSAIGPLIPREMRGLPPAFSLMQPQAPTLTPLARDVAGQPISGLVAEYVSLDPAIATVDQWTGAVTPQRPGPGRMVARTTAYGVMQVDTARFVVTLPVENRIDIEAGGAIFRPTEVWIVPNGVVLWLNFLPDSVDVTFEDPTNVLNPADGTVVSARAACDFLNSFKPSICSAGDILLGGGSDGQSLGDLTYRQFPVPGVYTFRSTRTGATGRIVVANEVPASAALAP